MGLKNIIYGVSRFREYMGAKNIIYAVLIKKIHGGQRTLSMVCLD